MGYAVGRDHRKRSGQRLELLLVCVLNELALTGQPNACAVR